MKDRNDKNINKTVVIAMALVIIASFFAMSYAFFSTVITNGTIYTTSGTGKDNSPNVVMTESNSGLSLTNAFPMTDQQGKSTAPYTFTIKNNGTAAAKYNLYIETKSDNTLSDSLVRYDLNGTADSLTNKVSTAATTSGYTTRYMIVSAASLAAGASTTYNLRTYIMDTATTENATNKTWVGKVTMEATVAN